LANREDNHGAVDGNDLHNGDQRMWVVWDQLDYHSVVIAFLEG